MAGARQGLSALIVGGRPVVWLELPSVAALPGNLAFSVWLASTSVALWRLEPVRSPASVPAPA